MKFSIYEYLNFIFTLNLRKKITKESDFQYLNHVKIEILFEN